MQDSKTLQKFNVTHMNKIKLLKSLCQLTTNFHLTGGGGDVCNWRRRVTLDKKKKSNNAKVKRRLIWDRIK